VAARTSSAVNGNSSGMSGVPTVVSARSVVHLYRPSAEANSARHSNTVQVACTAVHQGRGNTSEIPPACPCPCTCHGLFSVRSCRDGHSCRSRPALTQAHARGITRGAPIATVPSPVRRL
jgi:hypothetical protein